MRPVDFILLGLVLIGVGLAVFFTFRNRKKNCCGNCSSCAGCEKQRKNNG